MQNKIDHFAIGCSTLEQGMAYMASRLGVTVPKGGKHALMGTHNCVMQSGNDSFFELISIDPDAPSPGRPRWFSLDDEVTQERLKKRPRTLTWVVNTTDLDQVIATSPVQLGEVVEFVRGDRTWRLTVPEDGSMPGDGLLPAFIEWSPGPHPSVGQQDLEVRLNAVKITHPDPYEVTTILKALNVDHLVNVAGGDASLKFGLSTPRGLVELD